ncbi:MAG TPA: SRPBCC family protein [Chryseosolibacter sp.]|jgi:Uncharacterized conserved protein
MVNDVIITRSVLLNATPERVWEALTHPGMTKQYLYNTVVSCDWKKGSSLHWKGHYQGRDIDEEGKILDIVPGKMIKYSGFDRLVEGDLSRKGDIHITQEIIPERGKTKLLTTIDHFEGDETRAEYAAEQWDFEIMPRLQTLVETTL